VLLWEIEPGGTHRISFLLVPSRDGRPVMRLGVRLIDLGRRLLVVLIRTP
jgi:hypothetical protein